jgi:hypothetical protein
MSLRRTRIRSVSPKARAKKAAYSPLRADVIVRDGNACCVCGSSIFLHAHHRLLRSRGGRDEHENLVTVCAFHHRLIHAFPAWATAVGLIVPAGFDPMDWPVLLDTTRATWPGPSMVWQVPDGHGVWYARAPHPDQHQEPAPWSAA